MQCKLRLLFTHAGSMLSKLRLLITQADSDAE